jgi:hypothetical protein
MIPPLFGKQEIGIWPVKKDFPRYGVPIWSLCYWWQRSDIWSQASYRYPISWEAFLDPSDSYFLFADFVDFSTHWTYMLIFRRIFLKSKISNFPEIKCQWTQYFLSIHKHWYQQKQDELWANAHLWYLQ